MNRARLQKVKIHYNQPIDVTPDKKLLGEITVPYSQAYSFNKWDGWKTTYRLYYSSIHWVTALEKGPDGKPWYRILDELDETIYFVPASHVRIIPAEEISPITPGLPFEAKRIHVNLTTQILTAYEGDHPVFETKISSGLAGLSNTDISSSTPVGDFHIQSKYPSKHMGIANLAASIDDYVLPGVPWTSFFTDLGHAFHGTYWHDNFGVPMSHGCVNMKPEDAKWIFRWTRPTASLDDLDQTKLYRIGYGTLVQIRS